ncbi:hypothetical protein LCGC14_1517230 [marine sediment metagenome]|uniref:Uncharacterized protein n=1 Tax=marine sediment metagenome TaxID=412755 RepID=A0A0F9M0U9_9ZZZZ
MFTSGCGHVHMRDTYLSCSNCRTPRFAKRGLVETQNGLVPIWYLGCECPKPKGIL